MLKKTIEYEDYNGEKRKEDFYFALNKAEIFELQTSVDGGFSAKIQKAVNDKNVPEIMKIFKGLILKSIGRKSDDGKRFIKSKEISEEFEQSSAYPVLYMELATNANAAKEFMEAVIPALTPEQKAEVEKEMAKLNSEEPKELE